MSAARTHLFRTPWRQALVVACWGAGTIILSGIRLPPIVGPSLLQERTCWMA